MSSTGDDELGRDESSPSAKVASSRERASVSKSGHRGPRATRPGIVSVSSTRDEALTALDTRISQRSLGAGNANSETELQVGAKSRQKPPPSTSLHSESESQDVATKGGRRGPRATRPGIVSVSSGRNEALLALDTMISERSLGDITSDVMYQSTKSRDGKPSSSHDLAAHENSSLRPTRPGNLSVWSARNDALRDLDTMISQHSLEGAISLPDSGSCHDVPIKTDTKRLQAPRATRPGVVPMSSARDGALMSQESSTSQQSLGDGTSESLNRESSFREATRKADAKRLETPRATRPGVVSMSSGRDEALMALDTKISNRSRDEGNSCSVSELQDSKSLQLGSFRDASRKVDAKKHPAPRATRPGVVSMSSGREEAFVAQDASMSQRSHDGTYCSVSELQNSQSLNRESSFCDVPRKTGAKRLEAPRATRPGVVSMSSGRDKALLALDTKISQRSLDDSMSCSVSELQDSQSFQQGALRDVARKADAKRLEAPRATRPGVVLMPSGRDEAPTALDASMSQRSIEDGTYCSVSELQNSQSLKRESSFIDVPSKADAKRPLASRATRPGIVSMSSGRDEELMALDTMISQRSRDDGMSCSVSDLKYSNSLQQGAFQNARREVDSKRLLASRATSPGVVSMSSARDEAPIALDTMNSERSADDDGSCSVFELQNLKSHESLAVSATTDRRADEKDMKKPRTTRPGTVSVVSGGEARMSAKKRSLDTGSLSSTDYHFVGRMTETKRPGLKSTSSAREAALLDMKISQRSLGTEIVLSDSGKRELKLPPASRPGVTPVVSAEVNCLHQSFGGASLGSILTSRSRRIDEKLGTTQGRKLDEEVSETQSTWVARDEDSQAENDRASKSSLEEAAFLDRKISSQMADSGRLCMPTEDVHNVKGSSERLSEKLISTHARNRGWESFSSFVSIPEDDDLPVGSESGSVNLFEENARTDTSFHAHGPGAFASSFSSLWGSRSDLDSDVAAKQRARPCNALEENSSAANVASDVSISEHETIASRPTYFRQLSSRFGLNRGNSRKVLTTLDDRIAEKVASFGFTRPLTMTDASAKQEKEKKEQSEKSDCASSREFSGCCSGHFAPNGNLLGDDDFQYGEFGGQTEDGLAVALAVEEDDDAYLPAAVEFDPDAKPPIISNPRFRLCILLINIVVVVGIVGAAVGMHRAANKSKDGIPYRETLGIRENIASVVSDESLLSDPTSSFRKALEWMVHDDPLLMLPTNPQFVQRFLLARLYFATTEGGNWNGDCNPPEDGIGGPCFAKRLNVIDDQGHLDAKRSSTYQSEPGKHWLSDIPECEWAGVRCDEFGQVRSLRFSGVNMTGTFPDSMGLFSFLQTFEMRLNNFDLGPLRQSQPLKHVTKLDLQGNEFTGSIPSELYRSRVVTHANLGGNYLEGDLESSLRSWHNAKELDFSSNLLHGTVPPELASLKGLYKLRLNENNFEGSIPDALLGLPHLNLLSLSGNKLTGQIPSEPMTTSLEFLYADDNRLSGPIPESFFNNSLIYRVDLRSNALQGTISTRIAELTQLKLLLISDNLFSGTIPANISDIPTLQDVWLEKNNFAGSVPIGLCPSQRDGVDLWILESLTADCRADPSGMTEMLCDCCTVCCESDGEQCLEKTP